MLRQAKTFRRDLVQMLALRTPFAERYSVAGPDPYLAKCLGVQERVLREAAVLWRKNEDTLEKGGVKIRPKVITFKFYENVYRQIEELAKKVKMEPGAFVRSFLHAAMQTDREPTIRPELDRRKLRFLTTQTSTEKVYHTRRPFRMQANKGLFHALDARARTCGITFQLYVLAWLTDLFDKKLTDLTVVPVDAAQTFVDVNRYLLPMPSPEELENTTAALRAEKAQKKREIVNERYAARSNRRSKLYTADDVKKQAKRQSKKPKVVAEEDEQDDDVEGDE